MAGMGGQQGSTPHQRLLTQLCRSVVIAGCTCQPTSQAERVSVTDERTWSWEGRHALEQNGHGEAIALCLRGVRGRHHPVLAE